MIHLLSGWCALKHSKNTKVCITWNQFPATSDYFHCQLYHIISIVSPKMIPLKETYNAPFHVLILFCVINRTALNALVFQKLSVLAPARLLLLNTKFPLIGQPTHAWASSANNSANPVLCAILAARQKWCKCVTWWRSVMSQSHQINGGTTDEEFQAQCFLWENGASVAADFNLFNFQHLSHAQEPISKHWMTRKSTTGLL